MTRHYKALGLAAAIALSPMIASAATVDIAFQNFGTGSASDISDAKAALDTFMGSSPIIGAEDFEGFTACQTKSGSPTPSCDSSPVGTSSPIQSTAVGNFSGIGPTHSGGGSQVLPTNEIVVRTDTPDPFRRYDVVGGANWLDSNDLNGILWEIPGASGLSNILKIAFFLTDVNDVGSVAFKIRASDANDVIINSNVSNLPNSSNRPNGELLLVTMNFSEALDIINIGMTTGTGDGFGIDGIQVGTVPLPAAGWLMIAGLGGLAALRRRKRAA